MSGDTVGRPNIQVMKLPKFCMNSFVAGLLCASADELGDRVVTICKASAAPLALPNPSQSSNLGPLP